MTSQTYNTIIDALHTATSETAVRAVLARYAPEYEQDRQWDDVAETAFYQIQALQDEGADDVVPQSPAPAAPAAPTGRARVAGVRSAASRVG